MSHATARRAVARKSGADALVTSCPLCYYNLDKTQQEIAKTNKVFHPIPILYFTQLMGLAFGESTDELGFGKEFIDATPALAKIGAKPPKKPRKERRPKEALPMPSMPEEDKS